VDTLRAEECLELISHVPVGRVGVTMRALPVIIPVNFQLLAGSIYARIVEGSSLAAATSNAVVAFEVDSVEADGKGGWSVSIQGTVSPVTDPAQRASLLSVLPEPWDAVGDANLVVRLEIAVLSGTRVTRSSGQQ
jgi:nitroimidazol reductase NimA-like FMN-containing flavoprotein (pyridoxamine 5'-phosphate oxidase superfamily)